MKNFMRVAIIIAFFFLTACGGTTKTMLCKKWLLDGEALKSVVEAEIKKLEKEKPEEAGMAKMMLGMMGSMFKDGGIQMEFKADGTCVTTAMSQSNSGKWELSEDKKSIIIKNEKGDEKMLIKELTNTRLALLPESAGRQVKKLNIKGMETLIFKAEKK